MQDAVGNSVLSETEVYTGGDAFEKIAWQVRYYNGSGQPVQTYDSKNGISESTWGCCGKESEIDASGIEHSYAYDDLDRLVIATKVADSDIITLYTYDVAGRQVATRRMADGLSQTTSNVYDKAGRLVQSIDQAGLVTAYAYGAGGRVATNSLPGGATTVTDRYLDGRSKSTTGSGVIAQHHAYGVNSDGSQWSTVYTGPDGTNSPTWTRTTSDMLGRTLREERPGFGGTVLTNTSVYNAKGQLVSRSTPGLADTLYEYDALGEMTRSGLDVDGDGTPLDLSETDRVSDGETCYEEIGGDWWRISASCVYPFDNSAVASTSGVSRTRLTGFAANQTAESVSIDIYGEETVSSTTVDRDTKTVTSTVDYPDSVIDATTVTSNGLLVSTMSKTGVGTTYGYDALERRTTVTDPRTGTTTTEYDDNGRVASVTDTASSETYYAYDSQSGRRVAITNALGGVTRYAYDLTGNVVRVWGNASYPVSYAFDGFGRMAGMSTYRDGSGWEAAGWPSATTGPADTTTWLYDDATGLLTNKQYADGAGPVYGYSPDGRLSTRTWARGDTTAYSYDPATGEMTNTAYSDADTPDVQYTYDRIGRPVAVTDAVGTRTFAYDTMLQLTNETVSGLCNATIERSHSMTTTGLRLGPGYDIESERPSAGVTSSHFTLDRDAVAV